MLKKTDKILIAGQEGMVGSAIYNLLKDKKYKIIECKRRYLDFTNYHKVSLFFKKKKPNIVINAAGKVGGILDNATYPIDYLNKNILIGLNIINLSYKYKIKKVINLGSACIYPKITKLPIKEEYLLSSYLEKTNEGYALAKIIALKLCEYYKKMKKKNFISIQPCNLYGENDNYDLKSSHVVPALIRKFYEAKINKKSKVIIWGAGKNKREFMHVNDLADAIFFLLKKNTKESFLNVGTNQEITIKDLANKIKKISGFKGKILFDENKPVGQLRRVLDSTKLKKMGWKNKISLNEGLTKVFNNFGKKHKLAHSIL
jgi:GDP-L-fucose synthase